MRLISISVTISLALLSSATLAQPSPTAGETIGRPPPLSGPPPISEPSGSATPYYTGPIPDGSTSSGRAVVGPDGSTKIVRAAPCTVASRETDGFTTCIGLPERWRRR
jgi:hypothetical protein